MTKNRFARLYMNRSVKRIGVQKITADQDSKDIIDIGKSLKVGYGASVCPVKFKTLVLEETSCK